VSAADAESFVTAVEAMRGEHGDVIRKLVDGAPALSPEQQQTLRQVLRPAASSLQAGTPRR